MDKIYVVTGIQYHVDVEKYHTRTVLSEHFIVICSTKEHAEEWADIFRAKDDEYLPDTIKVREYELIGQTYHSYDDCDDDEED